MPGPAAVRKRNRSALHGCQANPDLRVCKVINCLFAQHRARKRELQDGNRGRVIANDEGRKHTGWHYPRDGIGYGVQLCDSKLHFYDGVKENAHYPIAGHALTFDMFDVVDGGCDGTLERCDDALLHVFRRHAAVAPDHAHNRDVDFREDIRGHRFDGYGTKNYNQCRHHREGIRSAERQFYDPHFWGASRLTFAS